MPWNSMKSIFIILIILGFSASCTKSQQERSFIVSLPSAFNCAVNNIEVEWATARAFYGQKVQPDYEEVVVFDDDSNGLNSCNEGLQFDFENVPEDKAIYLQFLVRVLDVDTGTTHLAYADLDIDANPGEVTQNLNAKIYGNDFHLLGGRYMSSASDGPSGKTVGVFHPPGGAPSIPFYESYMYNGWFNTYVLDSNEVTLSLIFEDGTPIFTNVNAQSFNSGFGAHKLRFQYPNYYEIGDDNEVEGAKQAYYGYFAQGNNVAYYTGKQACFLDAQEGVPNLYLDDSLDTPLIYNTDTPSALQAGVTAGGNKETYPNLFTTSACDMSSNNNMILRHNRLDSGDGDLFGFRGPYQLMDPFAFHGGYTKSDFNGSSVINLDWQYLPGVSSPGLYGSTLFAKHQSGGGGDSGPDPDHLTCAEIAVDKGFQAVTDILLPAQTYAFTGIPGLSVNPGNEKNWRFMLCPFSGTAANKIYHHARIEDHCRGKCHDVHHSGWGHLSRTITSSNFDNTTGTGMQGGHGRVTGVTVNIGHTIITTGFTGGKYDGNEALIMIVGEDSNGCGTGFDPGMFEFTRYLDAGATMKIPNGTFLDNISTGVLNVAPPDPGVPFCYVQIVTVPHFTDVTISAGVSAVNFVYSGIGGGVFAMRASGKIDLQNDISASHMGYDGGSNAAYFAAGVNGTVSTGTATGTGGEYAAALEPSGGAGLGNGGQGASSSVPITSPAPIPDIQGVKFFFGGGGGYGDGNAANMGGNGGGAVFVAANKVEVNAGGALNIEAIGQPGASSAAPGAGGGAGGAVNFFARKITANINGTDLLNFVAVGGDGSNSGAEGGGGGGGWVNVFYCEDESNSPIPVVDPGASGTPGTASAGGFYHPLGGGGSQAPHGFCPNSNP